jgi:hypothetical protein
MEPETSSGITHGRDGDWVVTSINQFSSFDTNQRIVVCYCTYQPVTPDWEKLGRGAPVQLQQQHNQIISRRFETLCGGYNFLIY